MFRIRCIYDNTTSLNLRALEEVRRILSEQFSGLSEKKVNKVMDVLRNPLKYRFRAMLYVAEDGKNRVHGFALFSHDPELGFCYLDYLAAEKQITGRGIGGALYQRVRESARSLNAIGLFFECLPDDPALCRNPDMLKQNRSRLRFYESYGARPIINTRYETPVRPEYDCPPYLVLDDLGLGLPLRADHLKSIVKAILERKYRDLCPPEYVDGVVDSIQEDPVRLRPARYIKKEEPTAEVSSRLRRIALVVTEQHMIHHVRERGYVESPVRIQSILTRIMPTGLFERIDPLPFGEKPVKTVHDADYFNYFKRMSATLESNTSVYPYVFPVRNHARPPVELAVRAGYYCLDTFTPLNRNAFTAASKAVDCTLTAAFKLLEGFHLAYALVRPPGHHAERKNFGGFCYFNNGAIAAQYLTHYGRVAMLDIDYHHGNGQQTIFYRRKDVLTISIHGDPSMAYPYFTGFKSERGEADGAGYNKNYPLPEHLETEQYFDTLDLAVKDVQSFKPVYLIVLLGLDTARGDPTGSWMLRGGDFYRAGWKIGNLKLPTLVVQEGGYDNRSIGSNARSFFTGLWEGAYGMSVKNEKWRLSPGSNQAAGAAPGAAAH